MSAWGKHYPLFLCLMVSNIIFGVLAILAGAFLIDRSSLPESSVQLFNWLQKETVHMDGKEKVATMRSNEHNFFTFLYVIGILSVVFGIVMVLIGLDIAYMLCIRDDEGKAPNTGKYGSQVKREMGKVVATSDRKPCSKQPKSAGVAAPRPASAGDQKRDPESLPAGSPGSAKKQ